MGCAHENLQPESSDPLLFHYQYKDSRVFLMRGPEEEKH